jgi:hypothetical protein
MKKLFLIAAIILLSRSLFAFNFTDTTFTNDLNGDLTNENISVVANENEGTITLKVDDSKFVFLPSSAEFSEIHIVKINNKSYLLVVNPDYYGYESSLFYYDKKIDSIGTIWSLEKPEVNIKGIIKVSNWMGFWSADYEYHLIDNKLIAKYKDEYTMPDSFKDFEMKTTDKIYLHSSKMINAKGLYEIGPNIQVYIIKADIRNNCNEEVDVSQYGCEWYYIRSKTGTEGWIMLKDFQGSIDGIPWAG